MDTDDYETKGMPISLQWELNKKIMEIYQVAAGRQKRSEGSDPVIVLGEVEKQIDLLLAYIEQVKKIVDKATFEKEEKDIKDEFKKKRISQNALNEQ